MLETKIGIEYEGVRSEQYRWKSLEKYRKRTKKYNSIIYNPDSFPFDSYEALTELRFNPFSKSDFHILLPKITDCVGIMNDELGAMEEQLIPLDRHEDCLFGLNKQRLDNLKTMLKNKTGQVINYDFKTVLIASDKKPVLWVNKEQTVDFYSIQTLKEKEEILKSISTEQDRRRGGGIHLTISPVDPNKANDFVLELDKHLSTFCQGFKSKYRQQPIFRYKCINKVPMVEYMRLGHNYKNKKEFESFLKTVVNTVFDIHEKMNVAA